LYSLHPRKFEEVIAEIFLRNGFHVELTKATRDGGKDIIAVDNKMGISTKYIIECKRYSKKNKISIALVQRLLGVKIATSANKAILATTSTFTKDAMLFTSNCVWDLELKDYADIVGWLKSVAN
jgi:restriction system protein